MFIASVFILVHQSSLLSATILSDFVSREVFHGFKFMILMDCPMLCSANHSRFCGLFGFSGNNPVPEIAVLVYCVKGLLKVASDNQYVMTLTYRSKAL